MVTQIDWETAWAAGINEMNRLSTTNYWNQRAEDYSDMVLASDCNHEKRQSSGNIVKIFFVAAIFPEEISYIRFSFPPSSHMQFELVFKFCS